MKIPEYQEFFFSSIPEIEIRGRLNYRNGHVYHLEYDSTTLHQEYLRDLKGGAEPNIPVNYYPENNPSNDPINTWRGNGHLLFSNWVNYLYQTTPFRLEDIGD